MRLKITLRSKKNSILGYNYFYSLSAIIYKMLQLGSPEFSKFLHDLGYSEKNKKYKLFSFALDINKPGRTSDYLILKNPISYLHITSPMIDQFVMYLIHGSFFTNNLELESDGYKTNFEIINIESVTEPEFKEEMKFKMLSPLVLSSKRMHNSKLNTYYLRYDDHEEIQRILNSNLANKYKIISRKEYEGEGVELVWDNDYITRKEGNISKKYTIRTNDENIEIKGIMAPFCLKGDNELIKVGYWCGFGEKNSMGFGFTTNI